MADPMRNVLAPGAVSDITLQPRENLIAVAALASVSLMAVAWVAPKPRVFSTVANRQTRYRSDEICRPSH